MVYSSRFRGELASLENVCCYSIPNYTDTVCNETDGTVQLA